MSIVDLAGRDGRTVRMRIPTPGVDSCSTCVYYAYGQCRLRGPSVLTHVDSAGYGPGSPVWPRVADFDLCGDHFPRDIALSGSARSEG